MAGIDRRLVVSLRSVNLETYVETRRTDLESGTSADFERASTHFVAPQATIPPLSTIGAGCSPRWSPHKTLRQITKTSLSILLSLNHQTITEARRQWSRSWKNGTGTPPGSTGRCDRVVGPLVQLWFIPHISRSRAGQRSMIQHTSCAPDLAIPRSTDP